VRTEEPGQTHKEAATHPEPTHCEVEIKRFIRSYVARLPDAIIPPAVHLTICPFQTCESRRATQIASGLDLEHGFSSLTRKTSSTLDSVSRITVSFWSALAKSHGGSKCQKEAVRSLGARRKLRMKQSGDEEAVSGNSTGAFRQDFKGLRAVQRPGEKRFFVFLIHAVVQSNDPIVSPPQMECEERSGRIFKVPPRMPWGRPTAGAFGGRRKSGVTRV